MEEFIVPDDYVKYPILEGEVELFDKWTYPMLLKTHKETIEYYKIQDEKWYHGVMSRIPPKGSL